MSRQRRATLRPFTVAALLALVLATIVLIRPDTGTAAPARNAAATVTVDIRNFAYAPTPLVVPVGTVVTWTNYDGVGHDVTGDGEFAPIKSPLLGRNQSWSYTFTKPGTYRYHCSPHPFMQAEVRVTEASGPADTRTFPETGKTVSGRFLTYWSGNGLDFGDAGVSYRESLALFGLPISDEIQEKIGNGTYTVQYFGRARFEYHPENADPQFQVLLGQFGRTIRPADPPVPPKEGGEYFGETGHNLQGRFLAYWATNGGLPIFGLPISEQFQETLDGKPYTVQYFERARFELHPENAGTPYEVQLGQFGRAIYDRR